MAGWETGLAWWSFAGLPRIVRRLPRWLRRFERPDRWARSRSHSDSVGDLRYELPKMRQLLFGLSKAVDDPDLNTSFSRLLGGAQIKDRYRDAAPLRALDDLAGDAWPETLSVVVKAQLRPPDTAEFCEMIARFLSA